MQSIVLVFLATGFEEIEAITPIDVLRRAGIDVKLVSISNSLNVVGAHGISIIADILISDVDFDAAHMLLLPGGMPGTKNLQENRILNEQVAAFAKAGKWLAAICAAPSILGLLGLLNGKKATCYPGWENKLLGATIENQTVVCDGLIITSNGVGGALDFALEIVTCLQSKAKANELAAKMVYTQ